MSAPNPITPLLEESTPTQEVVLSWDQDYDNPDAKVILVSSDRVGFRVEAWYLKRNSDFFKDLMDVPSPESIETCPIELEYGSAIIRHFLHHVRPSSLTPVQTLALSDFMSLFELCDMLQAPDVDVKLRRIMQFRVRQRPCPFDPWRVFKFAAKRDDVHLARESLRALGSIAGSWNRVYRDGPRKNEYDDIPSQYLAGLLLAGLTAQSEGDVIEGREPFLVPAKSWLEIANAFKSTKTPDARAPAWRELDNSEYSQGICQWICGFLS